MKIPTLYSAKRIERQFYTGEECVQMLTFTTSVWKNFTECLTENMNNHEI